MSLKWKTTPDGSVTLPKGMYYIGDLCYIEKLSDDWGNFCDEFFKVGHSEISGIEFFAAGTADGDGEYAGSDGFGYLVDAGLIGIISAKHLTEADLAKDYINVTKFDKPFTVSADKGVFYFGHIVIDTAGSGEDSEEGF